MHNENVMTPNYSICSILCVLPKDILLLLYKDLHKASNQYLIHEIYSLLHWDERNDLYRLKTTIGSGSGAVAFNFRGNRNYTLEKFFGHGNVWRHISQIIVKGRMVFRENVSPLPSEYYCSRNYDPYDGLPNNVNPQFLPNN